MSRARTGLVVLSFLLAPAAHGQAILSYESLDRRAGDDFYANLRVSADGNTGNTEYLDLSLGGAIGHRPDAASGHWLRFYPQYRLKRSDGRNIKHERSAHLRHSYSFSELTRTFAFVQIQANESIDLDRRVLVGGGLRRQVSRLTGGGLDIGVGLMLEDELLASGANETVVRGANLLSAEGNAGIVELTLTGFYQPIMSDFGDHHVSFAADATIPLSDDGGVAFGVSGFWRRDSRPPSGTEADDAGLELAITFTAD